MCGTRVNKKQISRLGRGGGEINSKRHIWEELNQNMPFPGIFLLILHTKNQIWQIFEIL